MLTATLLICATDQWLKALARGRLREGESLPTPRLPGLIRVVHVENPGTAYGALPDARWLHVAVALCVVAAAFLGALYWSSPLGQWSLGLLSAGSVSNVIDRMLRGTVTDYVALGRGPVFNLADVAINAGLIGALTATIAGLW